VCAVLKALVTRTPPKSKLSSMSRVAPAIRTCLCRRRGSTSPCRKTTAALAPVAAKVTHRYCCNRWRVTCSLQPLKNLKRTRATMMRAVIPNMIMLRILGAWRNYSHSMTTGQPFRTITHTNRISRVCLLEVILRMLLPTN
jgi:hypothetical protein